MLRRVSYINLTGAYRPHLETIFFNPRRNKIFRTLSLVDSGADNILIPHSLGLNIDLEPPNPSEFKAGSGVGGTITSVERECQIALSNADGTQLYVFNERVNWVYPKPEVQENLVRLFSRIKSLEQAINSGVSDNVKAMLNADLITAKIEVKDILDIYETDVLLGRSFFINFDWVQFLEKERSHNSKFIYKVRPDRMVDTITLSPENNVSRRS